jgi:NADH:ubiquinone oxidoreductase subunit 5 (subunit L)/multisubunit Na+/H+ antiporter MnhA subunit
MSKALLFLGLGNVYRAAGTYELAALGGLRRRMPVTAWAMLAATMAISGVPLLSGFYSKDAILADAAHLATVERGSWALFAIPAVGSVLTAFAMFRLWFLMFGGEPRGEAAGRSEEAPGRMTGPLVVLAVLSVVAGWPVTLVPVRTPVLEGLLEAVEPLPAVDVGESRYWAMGASVLVAAVGGALAAGRYSRWRVARPGRPGPVRSVLVNGWYFDVVYETVLVRPVVALAGALPRFDRGVIDGVLHGAAAATRGVSRASRWVEVWGVEGGGWAVGAVVSRAGDWSRRLQTGDVRASLGFLAAAVVAVLGGMFWWIG